MDPNHQIAVIQDIEKLIVMNYGTIDTIWIEITDVFVI